MTGVTNPAAVVNWGVYSGNTTGVHTNWTAGWPTNGVLTFQGDAGWYVLQSFESWNANFGPQRSWQSKYTYWFRANAFGGSAYSRTPVGAMSHVAEPYLPSHNTATWATLWHLGKPLGIVTWIAKDWANNPTGGQNHDQTNGDPLVAK